MCKPYGTLTKKYLNEMQEEKRGIQKLSLQNTNKAQRKATKKNKRITK